MVKTAISKQWVENQDYELIPRDDNDWHVRVLTGEFVECIIRYGNVRFDEQNATMHFDFTVVESTDESFDSAQPELQKVASHILHSILIGALDEHNT